MMKRVCSLIIVAAIVFSLFSNVFAREDNYKYFSERSILNFNRQLGFLTAIGAFPNSAAQDITATVSRIDFAQMLIKLMNVDQAAMTMSGETFSDVQGESAQYAEFAVFSGLMKSEEGKFRPDDALTYNEAVFAFVNLLGYGILAENDGGSLTAYEVIAKKIGVIGGNDIYGDYPVTMGILLDMTDNCLDIDFFGRNFNGEDYSVMTGRTIMTEFLKASKRTGVVYGAGASHIIRPEGPGKNRVEVEGEIFEADVDYSKYLGMTVDYYTKESSGRTRVVYMIESRKNNVVEVDAKDMESYSDRKYTYYVGEKKETAVLTSECLTIFNNSAKSVLTDEEQIPKNGYIQFIDNNDDSKFDVVKITAYSHYVVGSVYKDDMTVYDKYYSTKKLNLLKTEVLGIYSSKGISMSFDSIQEGDVLTVVENSDRSIVNIFVSKNTVEGTVTKITERDGEKFYTIGGNAYKFTNNYVGGDTVSVYSQGIFRLDINGEIVAFEKAVGKIKLGYLVKAAIDDETAFNEKLLIRLFSEDGDMLAAPASSKIKIDGKICKTPLAAYSALLKGYAAPQPQVVQFVFEDGAFQEIVTAYNRNAADEGKEPLSIQPPEGRSKDSLRVLRVKESYYSSVLKTVGNVGVGSNTIVFEVPEVVDGAEDDDFGISSGVNAQTNVNCEIYGAGSTNLVADAVVTYGSSTGTTKMGVVSDVEGVLDSNGTPCTRMTILYYPQSTDTIWVYDGLEKSAPGKSDGKTYSVEAGDVIEYTVKGVLNKTSNIFVLCKASEKGMARVKFTNPFGHISHDYRRYSYGAINESSNGFYQLSFCDPSDYADAVPSELTELYTRAGLYFIEVDTSGRETVVSRKSDMTGRDYKKFFTDCDYAFIALEYGYTRIMVVYK